MMAPDDLGSPLTLTFFAPYFHSTPENQEGGGTLPGFPGFDKINVNSMEEGTKGEKN
jgi:hypothetical protein